MNIIKSLLFLIFFIFFGNFQYLSAQKPSVSEYSINEGLISVNVDPLDYIYLFTDSLQLKKYDSNFKLMYRYSDNKISASTKIITDNAFKTILFNPDFGWIKILDRRFGDVAEFQIFLLNVLNVSAIGAAADNQSLWLYDNMQQNLLKLDQQFKITLQRNNLHIELGQWINPSIVKEQGGWLFLYDQEKGVFIFDNLGTFYKRIPIFNSSFFQVKAGDIFFQSDSSFHKYNIQTISTEVMNFDVKKAQHIIGSNYLFHYDLNKRIIYKQEF